MKSDHTRIIAELRANVCGRASSVMQRLGMACVLACAAAMSIAPVQAQDRGGFRKDDLQQQPRDDRSERNGQRQESTRFEPRDARDARADEMRRQQEHNAERQRQSGRLTADERRDLRRQINEAGVDLYPNTPRR